MTRPRRRSCWRQAVIWPAPWRRACSRWRRGLSAWWGPRPAGKTTLGVLLAKRYGGEVVSADSMQIYRGMTIGTAAPTPEEVDGVPHHMIAVADRRSSGPPPGMPRRRSRWWMTFLPGERCPFWWAERGCGWTPWCGAMALRPARPAARVRRELEEQLRREGIAPLLEQLRQVDPESAARLHPSDEKRILRHWRSTGRRV